MKIFWEEPDATMSMGLAVSWVKNTPKKFIERSRMLETEGNLWLKCKMGPVTSCKWDEKTRIGRIIYI